MNDEFVPAYWMGRVSIHFWWGWAWQWRRRCEYWDRYCFGPFYLLISRRG